MVKVKDYYAKPGIKKSKDKEEFNILKGWNSNFAGYTIELIFLIPGATGKSNRLSNPSYTVAEHFKLLLLHAEKT